MSKKKTTRSRGATAAKAKPAARTRNRERTAAPKAPAATAARVGRRLPATTAATTTNGKAEPQAIRRPKPAEAAAQASVRDFCRTMESLAPTALAQPGDNVGLIAGDLTAGVRRVLFCIDLTPRVAEEAIKEHADLVMAYHPPIYCPITTLRTPGEGTEATVFHCIRHGVAIYSAHTALDAADDGTNDALARACGIEHTDALETVDDPRHDECKLVVFVPATHLEDVADAMFNAGAGRIGNYERCSYRLNGQGTFLAGESANPVIGERGRTEYVNEIRLEIVVPAVRVADAVAALRRAHPYEEPAFDLYPLRSKPVRGIGRVGVLPQATPLGQLARKLRRAFSPAVLQVVGDPEQVVRRAILVAGAAGSLPFRSKPGEGDVVITGEIRHHDALTLQRSGCAAVALGHWASERPVLAGLAERVAGLLPGVSTKVSLADQDPFQVG